MKIVFAGSPKFSQAALTALIERGQVIAVITQPDRPVGRKKALTPTPVKQTALSYGIPVYDFAKIRDHVDEIKALGADIMITCAYGQILTREILDIFPKGVWNLHASLLPKYRGASPIQSAILAGEEYTGITVMRTELELDAGDMLLVKRCAVAQKTCGELEEELSLLAAEAAVETVGLLEKGDTLLLMQDEAKATYCKKITKDDARVDFSAPSQRVANLINAMSPSPAAYARLNGTWVNLLQAMPCEGKGECGEVLAADKNGVVVACADGAVNVRSIQFAGGKRLSAADAVNGRKIKAGDKFD